MVRCLVIHETAMLDLVALLVSDLEWVTDGKSKESCLPHPPKKKEKRRTRLSQAKEIEETGVRLRDGTETCRVG